MTSKTTFNYSINVILDFLLIFFYFSNDLSRIGSFRAIIIQTDARHFSVKTVENTNVNITDGLLLPEKKFVKSLRDLCLHLEFTEN